MDKVVTGPKMMVIKPNWPKILGFLFIVFIIFLIISAITTAFTKSSELATPGNIARIKEEQKATLEDDWTGPTQGKKGLPFAMAPIPSNQQLLINTSVMSTRLLGYSGPFESGVFDEDTATRIALASGARCLVLEIDHEMHNDEPKLIYRDGWGIKQSLNIGSLNKVAKSLAGRAFNAGNDAVPPLLANDPLILALYVVNTPSPATNPQGYVRFLAKIAEQLQPIKDVIVGLTPQGDFRRQALESQLFFQPFNVFNGKMIVLTNADTTPFRRLQSIGMQGEIGPKQDLDLLVHARLYSKQSPSGLGITAAPANSVAPAAFVTTPEYWLTIPPDRIADAQDQTKKAWTLVMPNRASSTNTVKEGQLKTLLTQMGVHAVPFCLFDEPPVTSSFTGKTAPYEKVAWSVKPELIRFIPPAPIVLQKPSPQTNANGGKIIAPGL
jgi:hypothetical protein